MSIENSEWPVKKGDRFLLEVVITEDHDLFGADLLRVFYNKIEGFKPKGFNFEILHLTNGMEGEKGLKQKMIESFNTALDEMFSTNTELGYNYGKYFNKEIQKP